jgi:cardiolipin synthase
MYRGRLSRSNILKYLVIAAVCFLLTSCSGSLLPGISNTPQCQSNCTVGSGIQGVQVFVEPDDGEQVITDTIRSAQKSIWLEIYILSDRNVIRTLEEASNRGLDVRVMLEPHPFGGGPSPSKTMDALTAAGIKTQPTSSSFPLTHEKGMIIDNSTAQFYDPNLVVSPINSRNDFTTLINSARGTLLIEAEEMNDSDIEQALANAAQRGVQVAVILPAAQSASGDSNSQGIAAIKQGGVQVREDPQLYMHAKIIIVDGRTAFVGSENISTQSLDQNRELGIIISDSSVLNKLQTTFQSDWSVSQRV